MTGIMESSHKKWKLKNLKKKKDNTGDRISIGPYVKKRSLEII